jgi:hypothetical protein
MIQRRVKQTDAFTGEELDGCLVYAMPKRINGFKDWLAMNQDAILMTLASRELGLTAHRVWAALMLNVDYENIIKKSQRQMAIDIGMSPQNFNAAVNQLCEEGLFIRFKNGSKTELRLNPEHGWKGSAKNHVIALSEVRKQRGRPATHVPA